jgi:uncharacterized membrane protein YkvA (DUF1232 family)
MAERRMKVSFTLDEKDISYFRSRFQKAKRVARSQDDDEVKAQARSLVETVRAQKGVPHFVIESVSAIEDLVALIEDEAYRVPKAVANKVIAALAYFADPDDLIPDEIPVLGFLDDAIMIKIVETEFKHELAAYRKFRRFQRGAEQRPWTAVARERLPQRLEEERTKLRAEIDRKQKADEKKLPGVL